jgi:two-component system sensor histidine kinase and response regulator WspE
VRLAGEGRLVTAEPAPAAPSISRRKRILVVDDSLTVRELERKLLTHHGYEVEIAVDGMDGWNAARAGGFDLVVTDVDMPRMDGIELVRRIKQDERLKKTPVMIVSYKDREEDRLRGLEAGADAYVTKSSFQEESWIGRVVDLIGEPTEEKA